MQIIIIEELKQIYINKIILIIIINKNYINNYINNF